MKKLPVVMPANLVGRSNRLADKFPERLGVIFSPRGWADPKGLPYALDNGRFVVWSRGVEWERGEFDKLLDKASALSYPPSWLAVPDAVADSEKTLSEWKRWHPRLALLGWPLALVVQDGMTSPQVRRLRPAPDVIFVGGSTSWKHRTMKTWCKDFPRVHVGRINTGRLLWAVHEAGAESSDGTGWWHVKQAAQLERYLDRSSRGLSQGSTSSLAESILRGPAPSRTSADPPRRGE